MLCMCVLRERMHDSIYIKVYKTQFIGKESKADHWLPKIKGKQ
jgi:hypothetical protein